MVETLINKILVQFGRIVMAMKIKWQWMIGRILKILLGVHTITTRDIMIKTKLSITILNQPILQLLLVNNRPSQIIVQSKQRMDFHHYSWLKQVFHLGKIKAIINKINNSPKI